LLDIVIIEKEKEKEGDGERWGGGGGGGGGGGEKSLIITLYYVGHRSCRRIVDPPLLFFALVPNDRSL